MDLQQFKQSLKDLGIDQRTLANDLGISFQQVTNWNKKGKYPRYVISYLELSLFRKKIRDLNDSITSTINKSNDISGN